MSETYYNKISASTISAFFTKLKNAFWSKSDVTNVALSDVAVTGSYNDLSNKPTIPTVPDISTNISTDATSDTKTASPKAVKTYVDEAGYYTKPSGGIPSTDIASGVIPDVSGFYTKPSGGIPSTDIASGVIPDITGKADKVGSATNGNFAALDSNGNLIDSGHKHSDYLTGHQSVTDNNPSLSWGTKSKVATIGSTEINVTMPSNPNTDTQANWNETNSSSAAYIQNKPTIPSVPDISTSITTDANSDTKTASPKAVKTYVDNTIPSVPVTDVTVGGVSVLSSGTAVIPAIKTPVVTTQPNGGFLPNTVYDLGEINSTTTFSIASASDTSIVNIWHWSFITGSTAPTITWPSNITWFDGSAPTINVDCFYEINIRYIGSSLMVGYCREVIL